MSNPRFRLLSLLSEACELEHGLACSYLYAAFSLKQDLEDGITWQVQQKTRLWASQILEVAAEEMFHLAQVWNLLIALGGTPWYQRPAFPLSPRYYPIHLALETRPFGLSVIERFIEFERPEPQAKALETFDDDAFHTVGELYRHIERLVHEGGADLFIGDPSRQVGRDLLDFPNLIAISDEASASLAIETIIEQGEGTPGDREDSHFDIFQAVRRSLLSQMVAADDDDHAFLPAFPCIENPTASSDLFSAPPEANLIGDAHTRELADTFDSIYVFMLRLLGWVFDTDIAAGNQRGQFAQAALRMMTTVLKPLGEALASLPAGPQYENATAGAPFGVSRTVALPWSPDLSRRIANEKQAQLSDRLTEMAKDGPAKVRLAATHLGEISI
jgi:SAM-dependent methyltransferase